MEVDATVLNDVCPKSVNQSISVILKQLFKASVKESVSVYVTDTLPSVREAAVCRVAYNCSLRIKSSRQVDLLARIVCRSPELAAVYIPVLCERTRVCYYGWLRRILLGMYTQN